MDSNFRSSLAVSSHDWQLYKSWLLTQASKSFILVDINILLSINTCLSSFHFWKADEMRKLRYRDGSSLVLFSIRPRYLNLRTFLMGTPPREKSDGKDFVSTGILKAMVSVLSVAIFNPKRVKFRSYILKISASSSTSLYT